MDDRRLLTLIGETLYGDHWKTPLSEALGIKDRSVRRWFQAGDVPEWCWSKLFALVREREKELGIAAEMLRKKMARTD